MADIKDYTSLVANLRSRAARMKLMDVESAIGAGYLLEAAEAIEELVQEVETAYETAEEKTAAIMAHAIADAFKAVRDNPPPFR